MTKSLMRMLLDGGVKREDMGTSDYNSDLHIYVTPLTTEIVEKWCKENGFNKQHHCPTFTNAIDGKLMYECIFANDEYWAKVEILSKQIEGR